MADALKAAAVGATLTMLTEEGVGPVAVDVKLFGVGRDECAVRDLCVVGGELPLGYVIQRLFQEVSDFLHDVD